MKAASATVVVFEIEMAQEFHRQCMLLLRCRLRPMSKCILMGIFPLTLGLSCVPNRLHLAKGVCVTL